MHALTPSPPRSPRTTAYKEEDTLMGGAPSQYTTTPSTPYWLQSHTTHNLLCRVEEELDKVKRKLNQVARSNRDNFGLVQTEIEDQRKVAQEDIHNENQENTALNQLAQVL